MSRNNTGRTTEPEEEPSEHEYRSDDSSSVGENLFPRPRTVSDDDSSDTLPLPPTRPNAPSGVEETWRLYRASARGPLMKMTPRKRTGRLPVGPLAPRDRTPTEPPLKRLRTTQPTWMPGILRRWRMDMNLPSTYEIGESSRPSPPVPFTGEPLEITVPTLVAITNHHARGLSEMAAHILELQSDTSRLDGDMISTYERLETAEEQLMSDREAAQATLVRVGMLERRARIAETVAAMSLMISTFMATLGMYLSFYR